MDIDGSSPLWKTFISVYEEAFPEAERVSLECMDCVARMRQGHLTVFLVDGEMVGFASWVETEHIVYLAYLATCRTMRSRGVGSAMVGRLMDMRPGVPLVADVEQIDPSAENAVQREGRQSFYLRCGLAPTGWRMPTDGTVYDVFCSSEAYDPAWEKEAIGSTFGPPEGPEIRRTASPRVRLQSTEPGTAI